MSNGTDRLLNPLLALISLYQKDKKDFKELIEDITARMQSIGIEVNTQYITDKVLPWVLSFLFMTMSQIMLDEYVKSLANIKSSQPNPTGPPSPPPAELD